jgi:GT2 family glycosyltransferase
VVDNNSVDGSQQMLREKFPWIKLIESKENLGFSKGNNLAMRKAKGEYVLLLNPDTIVEESTFRKCLAFMDSHPEAGALGVKMLDGEGNFLPESKRGLPTPWVAFYKIFGVAKLFPRSKRFGRYHLGYLSKDEDHEVEVLSGAFMFMRKETLDKIGLLDETFFMYGEDIDLSYRVILGGYKNYYFSGTQIIHYKGESTKKGSLNYVKVFYNAMIIFARKHFGGSRQKFFIASIQLAVYMRALMAIGSRVVKKLGFPILEGLMIYATMYGIKAYWEHYVKYIEGGAYPDLFTLWYMPAYTLIFVLFFWLAGAYKKPYRLRPLVMAPFWAFLAIATGTYMFAFVENFSRAIVGLSAVFAMILAIANRGLINLREKGRFFFTEEQDKRIVVVGDKPGVKRVVDLIKGELDYPVELVGAVNADPAIKRSTDFLGELEQIREIVRFFDIDEIVFCNESISSEKILDQMLLTRNLQVTYKIVPPQADYIVGPQAIHTSRYSRQLGFRLQQNDAKWRKQAFDVLASSTLLLTFPLLFWLYKRPGAAFVKLIRVFSRQYHMVGYIDPQSGELPPLKPGLLSMLDRVQGQADKINTRGLDTYYARRYRWDLDLEIVLKGWRKIH